MEVVCTIGSQGLSDGRRFSRGDVYEVDDDIASTLILNGYAEERVAIKDDVSAVVKEDVVEDAPESEKVVGDETVPKTSGKPKNTRKNRR